MVTSHDFSRHDKKLIFNITCAEPLLDVINNITYVYFKRYLQKMAIIIQKTWRAFQTRMYYRFMVQVMTFYKDILIDLALQKSIKMGDTSHSLNLLLFEWTVFMNIRLVL